MRAALTALLLVLAARPPAAAQVPTPASETEDTWWKDTPTPRPAPPLPTPAPTPGPMVGVLVRTTAGGAVSQEAIEAGIHQTGHRVFEGGAVRAYLAFQPPGMSFDDAQCQALRTQFRVDRLLVVEVRGQQGGTMAVRLRAFDPEGRVTSKFLEASPPAVEAAIVAAFAGLPPVRDTPRTVDVGALGPVVSPPRIEVDTVDVRSVGIVPIAVFQPQPPYPIEALASDLTGVVKLEIVVGAGGHVASVRALNGDAPFLEPAIATVRRWRYQPVLLEGRPVAWKSTVKLTFQLRPSSRSFPGLTKPPPPWRPPVVGDSGTQEVGLLAGRSSGSSSTVLEKEADSTSRDQEWALHAFAGAFARDRLELQGRLEIASEAEGRRKSEVGLAFGVAYLLRPADGVLVGPQVVVGLSSRAGEEKRPGGRIASFEGQGTTGFAGISARIPVGRLHLAVEAGGYHRVFGVEYSAAVTASGRATESGVRAVVGFAWSSSSWGAP